jgi:hypothetical protein
MKKIISTILLVFMAFFVYSQAILPTSWSFPTTNLPAGWTESGTNFYTASGNTPPAMKFDNTDDFLMINVNGSPGDLTYFLTGNGFSGGTFTVEESEFGSVWNILRTHTSPPNANYLMFTDVPQTTTRFIRFKYTNKVSGNIGLDDVSIDIGPATPAQEINLKNASSSLVSGSTFITNSAVLTPNLINFTIENLGTLDTLFISSASISGTHQSDYTVVSFPSFVLAGDTGLLIVDFTPAANGTREAILNISSNDVDESTYIINLYGIGGNLASEPTMQPTNLSFLDVKTFRITSSFTPADSVDGFLVLRKKDSPITSTPIDGIIYERGDVVGDAQVVFSDNITSFSPNNIIAGTDYYFSVFSYNGPANFRNYLINTPLEGVVTTPISMMPNNYYSNLNPSSSTFMNDLHALTNPHQTQYYSYYDDLMIPFFEARDTTQNRRVITCVYSGENKIYNEPFDFSTNGYSREHTYCHSWMPTNPAQSLPEYSDFHHLFPTNLNSVNILRSNNPLGEVANVTTSYLNCKSGTDVNGKTVFEPRDEHKGNAARAIMYEAICYNSVSGNNWAIPSTQDQFLLKSWHFQDPPDKWEIARNDFIDSLQNNRNPFIDSIDFVCYIDFSNMTYDASACTPSNLNPDIETKFIIYPNPSKNQLNLHVDGATITSYQIFDNLGRVIEGNEVNNKRLVKLNVSALKSGVYSVSVKTQIGQVQKSFIVD